jgi:peptide/nickel transport system substrate-binding protein
VKNPNYRDAATVAFDAVEMKGGGDAVSAARAALETGDVDYAWNLQVEPAVLEQIQQGGKGEMVISVGGNSERLLVNFADPDPALGDQRAEPTTQHPILSDIRVREALSLAIDRKTIQEQNYGAAGQVTCNILTAPPEVVSGNTKCDQDIARANQLLDEAGWKDTDGDGIRDKDGKPLRLVYQTTVNPVRQKTQAIIKANWKEIGVDTELKSVESGVFFSSEPGNPDTAGHFFADIEMFTTGNDNPDPTVYMDSWTCDNIAQKSNEWRLNNYMRWCNQEYTDLIAQIKKETDQAKRAELFIQANDILVADFAMIPLIARATPSAKATALKGPTGNQWDTELWNIAEWSK